MSDWQHMCLDCKNGSHNGGCCGCSACRVVPEPVAPLTRLELEEAMRHLRETQKRGPKSMHERYSGRLDDLLDQWVTACLEETLNEEA